MDPLSSGRSILSPRARPQHLLVPALLASLAALARSQACSTEAVAVNPGGAISPSSFADGPRLSADGRHVVWADAATDLVPGVTGFAFHVYLRDRHTATTQLVDVAPSGAPVSGGSLYFDMTPDLRYFALGCTASDLVPGDVNGQRDVFVLDRQTGVYELVSLGSQGQQSNFECDKPAISADGRFVVFQTGAALDPLDVHVGLDIYVRDRQLGTTRLASIKPDGGFGQYYNDRALISDDGRYVAWISNSPDWFPGDFGTTVDVFRKDMLTGALEHVSQNRFGAFTSSDCYMGWMSSDGRHIGFSTWADEMVADEPSDGFVNTDAFVRDLDTGTNVLLSRSSTGAIGSGHSHLIGLSADRTQVALLTDAGNLIPGGSNGTDHVVRKDLVSGQIELMSAATSGLPANDGSYGGGTISGDGRVVAFLSYATNLVPQAGGSGGEDLFLRECPAETGGTFCFGDGSGTACPCGNFGLVGRGCGSLTRPEGARLVAFGMPSVASDTIVLAGDSTTNSIVTYFQGTTQANGGLGIVFGDGLLCATGTVIRLGTENGINGTSRYPSAGQQPVSVRGQVPPAGGVRHYQIWYRIALPFCTPSTFSFSSAVSLIWTT